jgi:hypothetical protein
MGESAAGIVHGTASGTNRHAPRHHWQSFAGRALTVAATFDAGASAPHVATLLHRAHTGIYRFPPYTQHVTCLRVTQEGWLRTHRRDWYKRHLHINYSTRTSTFSATDPRESRQRRLTGQEGPSASALFQHSFPQPNELEVEEEPAQQNGQTDRSPGAEDDVASPLQIPRASEHKEDVVAPPEEEEEFVDAESEPDEELRVYTHQEEPESDTDPRPAQKRRKSTKSSTKSFVTASSSPEVDPGYDDAASPQRQEQASGLTVPTGQEEAISKASGKRPVSTVESTNGAPTSMREDSPVDAVSTTSLLRNADRDKALDADTKSSSKGILARVKGRTESSPSASGPSNRVETTISRRKSNLRNLVKFDIPEDSKRASVHLRAKQAQMTVQRASTKLRRRKIQDGLVVKMERMLVRVDMAGREVPDDFDENGSQKIDSRVKDKWREYMIVCRHSTSEDADFVLQMYKTRVSIRSHNGGARRVEK